MKVVDTTNPPADVHSVESLEAIRACTALAYTLPGMVVHLTGTDGKKVRVGAPSDRHITIHVADLRLQLASAIARKDMSPVERLLDMPLKGITVDVFSATAAVDPLPGGVWKLSSMGAVTYVAVALTRGADVLEVVGALKANPHLDTQIMPEELLGVAVIYVDVQTDAPDQDAMEDEILAALQPIAFCTPPVD